MNELPELAALAATIDAEDYDAEATLERYKKMHELAQAQNVVLGEVLHTELLRTQAQAQARMIAIESLPILELEQ